MRKYLRLFVVALTLGLAGTLTACGDEGSTEQNNNFTGHTDTGNGTYESVSKLADTREEKYVAYSADGEADSEFASMYEAINYVVNNMDANDFVAVGEDIDKKLFVNYTEYAEDTKDMFWYYRNGTELVEYTPWQTTYWGDLLAYGDVTVVNKEAGSGALTNYYHSAELVKLGEDTGVTGATPIGVMQPWHADRAIETFATVDMHAYSGITKSEYVIQLSQAQIAPSLNSDDKVYALVGFKTADSHHTSNMGIACDTLTGNWYYYSGEDGAISVDTSKVVLTSTWNTSGYFMPNDNVTVSCEIILSDGLLGDIFHNFTLKDSKNNVVLTKDYEVGGISSDSTIKFISGLDVVSINGMADYNNGAYMKNLRVIDATGTVTSDSINGLTYGNMTALEVARDYDLLNSNPQDISRFHTILSNPSYVNADFSKAGVDVYSYEFKSSSTNDFESNVEKTFDALIAIAALETVTDANRADVVAARALYAALKETQQSIIGNELFTVLLNAENTLGIAAA